MNIAPCSRRMFLRGAGAAGALALAGPGWRLAQGSAATPPVLVHVFLRGGFDGIGAVVPYGDPGYADLERSFKVPADVAAGLPLDGPFGLHPGLEALHPLYWSGALSMVHASGNPGGTRSHFEEQRVMERGGVGTHSPTDGWLTRVLNARAAAGAPTGLVRAVALGDALPDALAGSTAIVMPSIDRFDVVVAHNDDEINERARQALAVMGTGAGPVSTATRQTLDAIGAVRARAVDAPEDRGAYPKGQLGDRFMEAARIIRSGLGTEVIALDGGGWDLHSGMGTHERGTFRTRLEELAGSMRAFHDDLGPDMGRVTVVVQSEFGRRLAGNASGGADHGHGNVVMVMAHGARRGVHGTWKSIAGEGADRGDLAVFTDYRAVLAEVIERRMWTRAAHVFPGLPGGRAGVLI